MERRWVSTTAHKCQYISIRYSLTPTAVLYFWPSWFNGSHWRKVLVTILQLYILIAWNLHWEIVKVITTVANSPEITHIVVLLTIWSLYTRQDVTIGYHQYIKTIFNSHCILVTNKLAGSNSAVFFRFPASKPLLLPKIYCWSHQTLRTHFNKIILKTCIVSMNCIWKCGL